MYETDKDANPFSIANAILTPSYISFETALSYYGLIPERVCIIKSASFKKDKKKEYKNSFGLFLYQDINKNAFPYDINEIEVDDRKVLIASPEKALLDLLSVISPRNNKKELLDLLFEDLRIDEVVFDELDKKKIIMLCDLYSSKTLQIFKKYLVFNSIYIFSIIYYMNLPFLTIVIFGHLYIKIIIYTYKIF